MYFVDERKDKGDFDEPSEGWVAGPALVDTIITSLTLCRYSGYSVGLQEPCAFRARKRHPDVDCVSLYFQAETLGTGVLDQAQFPQAQPVVRVHSTGDDVIGTTR